MTQDGKHTPGPWCISPIDGDIVGDSNGVSSVIVARMPLMSAVRGPGREAQNANARLIASAPDLLAACRAIVGDCPDAGEPGHIDFGEAMVMARDAIARATGGEG